MFLGLDLGTSSLKAILINSDDRVVAQSSVNLSSQSPQPAWSEQDPEDWWAACQQAILALSADMRREVRGIGLSGQMHGAVLLDAADQVLRPAILWNDSRSAAECAELERRAPRVRLISGNLPMPGFTAPKLLWVARYEPQVFRSTRTVLLPKDYLRLRLTGTKVSDMSDASGTLWLDVGQRAWSDELLGACDLQQSNMPLLVEGTEASGTLRPDIARMLGLPAAVVAGGGGDNAASAVGMGIVDAGRAFVSLGTSGVLFVATEAFRPAPDQAAHAFCHALPDRWHQMSVMLTASSALDWAVRLLGFQDAHAALDDAAMRGPRDDTPLFLPYLSGERTPHNDPSARGVFFGMTGATTRADLVIAVLEGVALAFADGLSTLIQAGGRVGSLTAVGGGTRHTLWLDYLAAALGRSLLLRAGGDVGAALGAARLGRMAVTHEPAGLVCTQPAITAEVAPRPDIQEHLRCRQPQFIELYTHLKPAFRRFSA
jgi:xylulokinase